MNKKLIALTIVPILIVMSGALAFSSFSGTANTHLTATAATVSFTETAYFNGTNAMNTPLTINDGATVTSGTANYSIETASGESPTLSLNVGNFVPSEWAKFVIGIRNTGSAALNLNTSGSYFELNSSPAMYVYNGTGFQLTPAQIPYSVIAPPETLAGFIGLLSVQPYAGNWTFAYGSVGRQSVPPYLLPGQTFFFSVYLGIGDLAGNSFQGASLSLVFNMYMTSAP